MKYITDEMYESINELYDKSTIEEVLQNEESLYEDIELFKKYNFECIDEIIVSYLPIFLNDSESLEEGIIEFIKKHGNDYVELVNSDMSLLEELL